MTQLFDRLQYNFPSGNGIIEFSGETKNTLNTIAQTEPFLDSWQFDALKNNDANLKSYLINPVSNVVNSIILIANTLTVLCSQSNGVVGLETVLTESQNIEGYSINTGTEESPVIVQIEGTGEKFFDHTQRLSGQVEMIADEEENTVLLPHYDTALAVGKSITYLVNQADGIVNNAPIMGSFTSVLIAEELQERFEIINTYPQIVQSSISCVTSNDDPPVTTCSSNLTTQQVTNITSNLNYFNTTFQTRRIHDENFYTNARLLMEDYDKMALFKDMGESERNLTNNFLGSPKLLANTNPSV
jgi:hypothetical protein